MHEGAEVRRLRGMFQIGIFQHDEAVLATEFHTSLLQMRACFRRDVASDRRRTGERDRLDDRVLDHLVTHLGDIVARAGDNVEHALRHTGLFQHLGEEQTA